MDEFVQYITSSWWKACRLHQRSLAWKIDLINFLHFGAEFNMGK
jgi:hypothetical protein